MHIEMEVIKMWIRLECWYNLVWSFCKYSYGGLSFTKASNFYTSWLIIHYSRSSLYRAAINRNNVLWHCLLSHRGSTLQALGISRETRWVMNQNNTEYSFNMRYAQCYETFTDHSTRLRKLFINRNMLHVIPPKMKNFISIRRIKLFRTLVRASVEMASVSDWMAVFSSEIVFRFFHEITRIIL
jgi:hypothetical protein